MLPGHHTKIECIAGFLLIVFEKHQCLTCRLSFNFRLNTQLSHYRNAAVVEQLRRLTRNQMGSSRVDLNPTHSGDSYLLWPNRTKQLPHGPTPNQSSTIWGIAVEAWCLQLNTMQPCPSWRSVAHFAVKS